MTSGAKAQNLCVLRGTAEAVPFQIAFMKQSLTDSSNHVNLKRGNPSISIAV